MRFLKWSLWILFALAAAALILGLLLYEGRWQATPSSGFFQVVIGAEAPNSTGETDTVPASIAVVLIPLLAFIAYSLWACSNNRDNKRRRQQRPRS